MENTAERMGTVADNTEALDGATPKELSEQVDKLHAEVHQIAKDMASLHAIEKSVDQKSTVIGRALVEQKNSSIQVEQNQAALNDNVASCINHAERKHTLLVNSVEQVDISVAQLKSVEKREDTLLKSLDKLAKDQQEFMDENKQFNKDANGDLELIKKSLQEICHMVSNMSFEDQVAFMETKAATMHGMLDSYINVRTDLHQRMSTSMADTASRIDTMQADMEAQRTAIESVVEISRECEINTNLICDKLELLLEAQKATQPINEQSLEDMFAAHIEEPEIEEPNGLFDDDWVESTVGKDNVDDYDVDDDDIDEIEDDDVDDYDADDEGDTEDDEYDDDTDARMYEIPPEAAPSRHRRTKKKGFFSRLFGGNG